MSIKTETKVGLLTLAAVTGLVWLSMESGSIGSSFSDNGYRVLTTQFESVEGLNIGSKIKISGVQVGEVSDIFLNDQGQASVKLAIKQGTPLPSNIAAQVASSGLIGEKFVALTTDFGAEGSLDKDVKAIPSKPAASVDDIASNFAKVSSDLESVTAALRTSLGGRENAEKLTRIVNSLDSIGQRMDGILNDEIKEGQVQKIVDNFADFSETINADAGSIVSDLRDASASLKNILSGNEEEAGQMIANFGRMANNMADITDRLQKGQGTLGKLLTDDGSAMEDLELAMSDFRDTMHKINSGDGTIGRLINDPSTVEKVEQALDGLAAATGRLEQFRTEVDFYGYSLMAEDVSKGRFEVTFSPRPNRYYLIGLTQDGFSTKAEDPRYSTGFDGEDFGDDMKITAQFGHVYENVPFINQDLGFRIGLRDSTFGVGADLDIPVYNDHILEVSADLYDFSGENNGSSVDVPHLDLRAKMNIIGNSVYATGGYDNVLDSKYGSPFIGVGFRFQDDDFKYLVGQAL